MRRRRLLILAALILLGIAPRAQARVRIDVDLETQTMRVSGAGPERVWPVSSGRAGYATPRGAYRAQSLRRIHYSRKYDNAPMPHAIFFSGGYAIHGSAHVAALGRPASHGCVRLAPRHAAELFALVKGRGADIRISGTPPDSYAPTRRAREPARSDPAGWDPSYESLAALEATRRVRRSPAAWRGSYRDGSWGGDPWRDGGWDGWR